MLFCHLVNDSSLRGGFLLNFLDDGQGMTQGKITVFTFSFSVVSASLLKVSSRGHFQRVIAVEVLIAMTFTSGANVGTFCGISSH